MMKRECGRISWTGSVIQPTSPCTVGLPMNSASWIRPLTIIPQLADRLFAAQAALIDLKEEIKHRPYFPVPSYSIKSVSSQYAAFDWSQADVDGQSCPTDVCLIGYGRATIRSSNKIEQYNREDVLAMLAVDRYVASSEAIRLADNEVYRGEFRPKVLGE